MYICIYTCTYMYTNIIVHDRGHLYLQNTDMPRDPQSETQKSHTTTTYTKTTYQSITDIYIYVYIYRHIQRKTNNAPIKHSQINQGMNKHTSKTHRTKTWLATRRARNARTI